MEYRQLGNTTIRTSVMGMGITGIARATPEVLASITEGMLDAGVNLIDVYNVGKEGLKYLAGPLIPRRKELNLVAHLGFTYVDNQEVKTFEVEKVRPNFEEILEVYETDYVEVGLIHIVDNEEAYEKAFNSEFYDYVKQLKADGKIKYIGLSSHSPVMALKAVEAGLIDVLMFSINPAYDMERKEATIKELRKFKGFEASDAWEIEATRQKLYATCEDRGVGIMVMKAMGAGLLLKEETSPFGEALTPVECMAYAMDRPAVDTVLLGASSTEEISEALKYLDAKPEDKNYGRVFKGHNNISMSGKCMYCNHCQPCVEGIDIAAVNKYLDIAELKGEVVSTVRDHYAAIEHKADACIMCGACEERCPFGVSIRERMSRAQKVFA